MEIQLKAKHLYLIVNDLKNVPASKYYLLIKEIESVTKEVNDDDVVTIQVSFYDILEIYKMLSVKPEGLYTIPNREMNDMLLIQIQQQVPLGSEEWLALANVISEIRLQNQQIINNLILQGKQFLHGVQ